jgi:hypothetical protein
MHYIDNNIIQKLLVYGINHYGQKKKFLFVWILS